ncbi:alpha-hydroxy-acid oxidizing protein [Pelagibacteraceae bacterium]|nr:alpha-hydroxy-acid oxidizing protein [Pelagibacteraceae bacterium]
MKKNFATVRQAETFAQKICRKGTFKWLQAAAEDGYTHNKNILDLNNIQIYPKHLAKILKPDCSQNFFGTKVGSPLILSPMGHQTQFHKLGEIEVAKGVSEMNSISFFGTQGRMSLDDIRKKNKFAKIAWTIFPFGNKNWILKQIKSSEKNKCIAIAVCIDANARSHRYLDRELLNYDARKYGTRTNEVSPNPKLAMKYDWKLIKFIKKNTKLPVIVKGIMTTFDAKKAINCGVDAIWISNHGGRMFNSGISSLESLIDLKRKTKIKKTKIIIDGGVRRGSDIIKYLCLGADFVGIGRPAIYGLICGGNKGVKKIFEILINELKTAMINGGFKNLKSFKKERLSFNEKYKN